MRLNLVKNNVTKNENIQKLVENNLCFPKSFFNLRNIGKKHISLSAKELFIRTKFFSLTLIFGNVFEQSIQSINQFSILNAEY